MKKVFIGLFAISCLFLTGCSSKQAKQEELDKFATNYYKNYMAGITGANKIEISLEGIKKVAVQNDYDIKKLKKCKDDTKVIYTIKDNKVKEKKFILNCD